MYVAAAMAIVAIAALATGRTASANPLFFVSSQTSQTSTSTVSASGGGYMTAGTGTTTLTLDSFANGNLTGTLGAVLLIDFNASNTSAVLNWNYEYSDDGSNWYADSLSVSTTTFALASYNDAPFVLHTWAFASSTLGTSQSGAATVPNHTTKAVIVPTPTRYVRARFYAPAGSTPVGLYAQFVGKKEYK